MLFYMIPAVLALTLLLLGASAWLTRCREPADLAEYLRRAHSLRRAGQAGEAIGLLERSFSRLTLDNPDYCEACFALGRLCCECKDYAQAGEWFDRTFDRAFTLEDFAYTDEFIRVFETYLMTGRRARAIELYRRLLALEGKNPDFGKIRRAAPLLGLAGEEPAPAPGA